MISTREVTPSSWSGTVCQFEGQGCDFTTAQCQSLIALEPLLIGPHPRRETIVIKMLKTIKVSVRHCAEAGGTSSVCFKRLLIVYICNFLHKSILFFWSKRSKLRP